MAITVYGRRHIRAVERATGERIVHAAGPWFTTVDHRHMVWDDTTWVPVPGPCALPLSSCRLLFGADEHGVRRHFMLGSCRACGAGPAGPHRHDCEVLVDLLGWPSINPDYWPRPVHRPMWMDDPRRSVPGVTTSH